MSYPSRFEGWFINVYYCFPHITSLCFRCSNDQLQFQLWNILELWQQLSTRILQSSPSQVMTWPVLQRSSPEDASCRGIGGGFVMRQQNSLFSIGWYEILQDPLWKPWFSVSIFPQTVRFILAFSGFSHSQWFWLLLLVACRNSERECRKFHGGHD